jgi:hypothetical protein
MTVNDKLSQIWAQMNAEIRKYEIIIQNGVDFDVFTTVLGCCGVM